MSRKPPARSRARDCLARASPPYAEPAMIDSHCHIAGAEFAGDLEAVVARARAAGLEAALVILAADDEAELRQAADVCSGCGRRSGSRSASTRTRPGSSRPLQPPRPRRWTPPSPPSRWLGRSARSASTTTTTSRRATSSRRCSARRSRLARRRRLPIVIHTREAEDDTFRISHEERAGDVAVVFHCFTGDRPWRGAALDAGFHMSLAGIVTFPRPRAEGSGALVPLDRLLIETDSPFLAPVPHRGKRNEPAHVGARRRDRRGARGETTANAIRRGRRSAPTFRTPLQPVTPSPHTD